MRGSMLLFYLKTATVHYFIRQWQWENGMNGSSVSTRNNSQIGSVIRETDPNPRNVGRTGCLLPSSDCRVHTQSVIPASPVTMSMFRWRSAEPERESRSQRLTGEESQRCQPGAVQPDVDGWLRRESLKERRLFSHGQALTHGCLY